MKASHNASTVRDGRPCLVASFQALGDTTCRFEIILFNAANGRESDRSARVRRNRSSIQEVGAVAEAVCSKRNLSAQATTGRNSNWS
jgi:hypothetical protein